MESIPQSNDLFTQAPKAEGTLKTLTLLTFIGCGLSYLGLLWNASQWGKYEAQMEEMQQAMDKLGDNQTLVKITEASMEMIKKQHDNRYVIFITGLLFTTLCLLGAMRMRKLQKSGYPLYVIGELAPVVINIFLLGFSLAGGFTTLVIGIVAIVFVILYTNQRKNLIY